VNPSDLRHLVPGSAVEPSSGYILRIGPPPPVPYIPNKSNASMSPHESTRQQTKGTKIKACFAEIVEDATSVKIKCESNVDMYREAMPVLQVICAALAQDLPERAATSRLFTPVNVLAMIEEDFNERNLATRSSVNSSQYASAGLTLTVEASMHHDVWLLGIATGHCADAGAVEIWASDGDDASSSASWNSTDLKVAPPGWKRVWGPGLVREGQTETEYRFEYPLRVPAGSRCGLSLRGDNNSAIRSERVSQEEYDSPVGEDKFITIHAGYAINPRRWVTEESDEKSVMVGRVLYTLCNPYSVDVDPNQISFRESPSTSAVLGPIAWENYVQGVQFVSACVRKLEERFADNIADFEAGLMTLQAQDGNSNALLNLLRRRRCPVTTHTNVLQALLEFRSSRTLPSQGAEHSTRSALKHLWGATEVDAIELSQRVAIVADPSRGDPVLSDLALTTLERLYVDILSSAFEINSPASSPINKADGTGARSSPFFDSIEISFKVSNLTAIKTHAASLAAAVLRNHRNRELQSKALHTLLWTVNPAIAFGRSNLSLLFSGGAHSVVDIAWSEIFHIALLSAHSKKHRTNMSEMDKKKSNEHEDSGEAALLAMQASSLLLKLLASHKPGVALSAHLANIVSTSASCTSSAFVYYECTGISHLDLLIFQVSAGAMPSWIASAEATALGNSESPVLAGNRVLELLAGGGRSPQTALLVATLSLPTGIMCPFGNCMQLWNKPKCCDRHNGEFNTEGGAALPDSMPAANFSDWREAINLDNLSPRVAVVAQVASRALKEARQGLHVATRITDESGTDSDYELQQRRSLPPLLTSSFEEPYTDRMRKPEDCLRFSNATRAWVFGCLLRDDVAGLSSWAFRVSTSTAAAAAEADGRNSAGSSVFIGANTSIACPACTFVNIAASTCSDSVCKVSSFLFNSLFVNSILVSLR
jgi:hypothetical protein